MEARVIVSKETMKKSKLNNKDLRELRLNKLKELDREGRLSKATCRTDVAKMLGFSGGYDNGYNWLCKVINKGGPLEETFLGINSQGKAEYEYHMKGTPQPKVKVTQAPVLSSVESEPAVLSSNSRVVIRYKELAIEVENVDCNLIADIVSKLADK